MKVPKKWMVFLLTCAACVSLVGATAYVWFFRITAPVVYGESLEFWYTDETLNGEWLKVGIGQTIPRPAVDLTKGVFDVRVLVNNTGLRFAGLRMEIKAVDTATGGTTGFIGFNVSGVGFNWATLAWEQELPASSLTSWDVQYVLSSEAPLGYTGFIVDWNVSRFETVVQERLDFTTISLGCHSGHTHLAYYVIQDNETWVELWNQHMLFMVYPLPTPDVDFSAHTVVAVFMGEASTSGYALRIYDIVDVGSSIVVKLEKTEPDPKCIVAQVLTQPYHMVQIAKTDKPVTFDVNTKILECP